MRHIQFLSTVVLLAIFSSAHGQSPAGAAPVPAELRERLTQSLEVASGNQLQVVNVKNTAMPGIFEVELNTGELLYSSDSGEFLFAGDMYQTSAAGLLNLSANTRQARTLEKIAAIPEQEMIVFAPEGQEARATLTVFTDVDCTYCRALHDDMEDILAQGIRIRYLAYPRGGENAGSFDKMISVWCSDDRHRSLTQAKRGQNLPNRDCESPVLEHYALGNEIGITGTPALVLEDGRLLPGYRDVETLLTLMAFEP